MSEPIKLNLNQSGDMLFLMVGRVVSAFEIVEAEAIALGILQILSKQKEAKAKVLPFQRRKKTGPPAGVFA